MNTKLILLFIIIAAFSSCTTAYKTGQTPDDVYYSPAPAQNDYVRQDNQNNTNVYNNSSVNRDTRRWGQNRRWRRYNDYGYNPYNDYGYYPYDYGYYPYDYRYGYDYPIYVDPKYGTPPNKYFQPRKYNLGVYDKTPTARRTLSGIKSANQDNTNAPVRTFRTDNSNNGGGVGNFIRKVFSGNGNSGRVYDNNNNTNNNTPTRTFDNSRSTNNSSTNNNSNSNSSSGSNSNTNSGGNAPVRKFGN